MEEALYGEGGYYATQAPRIGPAGDFITGSSLSTLFGASTAQLLERLAARLGGSVEMLEVGYGSGSHLAAVLEAADPAWLTRVLGWDRVARPLPPGAQALTELGEAAVQPIRGLVFSYELFDALPVHRLTRDEAGDWRELHVDVEKEGFDWVPRPLSRPDLPGLLGAEASTLEAGQIVDLAPGWRPLYRQLAESLGSGLLVTCDYGFVRRRLLDVRVRRHGTLACYRNQTVHRNPFVDVGSQDLTAHVDFTALAREGEAAGLETIGLVSQAEWLGACGVFDGLAEADRAVRLEAARLLDPGGMGSDIRVLVQARGFDPVGLFDLELASPRLDG